MAFRPILEQIMNIKLNPKTKEFRFMNEMQILLKSALNESRQERDLSLNLLRAELYKLYYHD